MSVNWTLSSTSTRYAFVKIVMSPLHKGSLTNGTEGSFSSPHCSGYWVKNKIDEQIISGRERARPTCVNVWEWTLDWGRYLYTSLVVMQSGRNRVHRLCLSVLIVHYGLGSMYISEHWAGRDTKENSMPVGLRIALLQVYLILDEFLMGGEIQETSKKVSQSIILP